jgi:hypothetical protein
VHVEPAAQREQALGLRPGDRAIAGRPHVQQQVAVLRHDVDQQMDERLDRQQVGVALHAVPAERVADAAAGLEGLLRRLREHRVLGRGEVVVPFLRGVAEGGEAVVHDAVRHARVVVGHEPQRLGRLRVADVVPQHRRRVALDQLAPVRVGVARVLGALRDRLHEPGEIADRPALERPVDAAGVVQPHAQALRAHRRRQVPDEVAFALPLAQMRARVGGGPEQEAVVVLGGEHDVARARAREQPRPRPGVPVARRRAEALAEALVGEARAVRRIVVSARRAVGKRERVPVPLGVRVRGERFVQPASRAR